MTIICDTHVLLYWADQPDRLSAAAREAVDRGVEAGNLACADISLWEIAMLFARGRLNPAAGVCSAEYTHDLLTAMRLQVLGDFAGFDVRARRHR